MLLQLASSLGGRRVASFPRKTDVARGLGALQRFSGPGTTVRLRRSCRFSPRLACGCAAAFGCSETAFVSSFAAPLPSQGYTFRIKVPSHRHKHETDRHAILKLVSLPAGTSSHSAPAQDATAEVSASSVLRSVRAGAPCPRHAAMAPNPETQRAAPRLAHLDGRHCYVETTHSDPTWCAGCSSNPARARTWSCSMRLGFAMMLPGVGRRPRNCNRDAATRVSREYPEARCTQSYSRSCVAVIAFRSQATYCPRRRSVTGTRTASNSLRPKVASPAMWRARGCLPSVR